MAELNEIKGFGEPCEGASIITLELAGGRKTDDTWGPVSLHLEWPHFSLFYTLNILLKCYLRFPKKQILRQKCTCQHFMGQCDAEEPDLREKPGEKEKWERPEGLAGPHTSPLMLNLVGPSSKKLCEA